MGCCGKARAIGHGIAGQVKARIPKFRAPEDVIAARREICAACEHCVAVVINGRRRFLRCTGCPGGVPCFLQEKTAIAAEECPRGRWAVHTTRH